MEENKVGKIEHNFGSNVKGTLTGRITRADGTIEELGVLAKTEDAPPRDKEKIPVWDKFVNAVTCWLPKNK